MLLTLRWPGQNTKLLNMLIILLITLLIMIRSLKMSIDYLRTSNLGDQAHQLQALISEMMALDPKSLQFEDEPKTWEEAKNSVDAKQWEEGYHDELKSLKNTEVYKLILQSDAGWGAH